MMPNTLTLRSKFWQAEIGEFDVSVNVNENILWF
jgi:hypothetical protein